MVEIVLRRGLQHPAGALTEENGENAERDARGDVQQRDAERFILPQAVRLLRERRERRVAAAEPDNEAHAQPVRRVMTVDERRDQQPDEKAAGEVDGERAPREERERAPLDGGVESVAGEGSERTAHRDRGYRWHESGCFMSEEQ